MVLAESDTEVIRKKFVGLSGDVEIIVFTQETECQFCKETRELALDLGALSPKIKVKIYEETKNHRSYNNGPFPGLTFFELFQR